MKKVKKIPNKEEAITVLEEELKKHWEDTKEEREKTHTTKIYQKLMNKKV